MSANEREIEAKFLVQSLDVIEQRLLSLGADLLVPRQFEYNLRYDDPKNSLRHEGKVLRLRRYNYTRMTFKGPGVREDGVLSRSEIEIIIDDFEAACCLLEGLGYHASIVYEKYRAMYQLQGRLITLDELPYGTFIEIEGNSPEDVRQFAQKLGLNPQAAIATSYNGLFDRICASRQLTLKNISFSEFEGLQITPEDMRARFADA